jgi:hypothetical protein
MAQSPAAIQLRYLQTLSTIATEKKFGWPTKSTKIGSPRIKRFPQYIYLLAIACNISIGRGKMIVEFFSVAMVLSVCKYRSWIAAGLCAIMLAMIPWFFISWYHHFIGNLISTNLKTFDYVFCEKRNPQKLRRTNLSYFTVNDVSTKTIKVCTFIF